MKPIKITFQGINSYKNKAEIIFTDFYNQNIFGIFGKTASGKSTIVDSISIALFKDIARDTNNFLNKGSEKHFVDFTFESNKKEYRIYREFKLNEKINSKPTTKKCILECISDNKTVATSDTEIENQISKILKVNKSNFYKTIILPQNKFSKLLHSNQKERRDFLISILSLDKYQDQLNKRINEDKNSLSSEINSINSKKETILENMIDENKKNSDRLELLRKKKDIEFSIINHRENLKKAELISGIKEQYINNEKIIEEIVNHRFLEVKSMVDNLKSFNEIVNLRKTKKQMEIDKELLEIDLNKIGTTSTQEEIELKKEKETKNLNVNKELLNGLNEKYKLISEKDINKINDTFHINSLLESKIKIYKDETDEAIRNVDKYMSTAENNINGMLNNIESKINKVSEDVLEFQKRNKIIDDNIEKNVVNKKNILIQELLDISEDNSICPICGSELNDKLSKHSLDDCITNDFSELKEEYEKNSEEISKLKNYINTSKDKYLEFMEILNKNKFNRDTSTDKPSIENLGNSINDYNEWKIRLDLKKEQLENAIEEKNSAEKLLINVAAKYKYQSYEEIYRFINTYEKRLNDVTSDMQKSKEEISILEDQLTRFGEIKNIQDKITGYVLEINNIENNVKKIISDSGLKFTSDNFEHYGERQEEFINWYNNKSLQLNIAKKFNDDNRELFEKEDSLKVNDINKLISELSILNQENDIDLGKIQQMLDDNEKRKSQLKEIELILVSKEKDFEKINDLWKVLFNNSKMSFVDYIANHKFNEICKIASKFLLEMSNQRYIIKIDGEDEKENLIIIDNYSNEKRSVSSLSGGETFITSLSLALAISNYISANNSTELNFFFIDEGFGTLDEQSLELVIESINNLVKRNDIIIGFITHVEKLKNITAKKINVSFTEEKGSFIE